MKKHIQRLAQIALMLFVFTMMMPNVKAQPAPTNSGPFGSTLNVGVNGDVKYWDGSAWIAVSPGLPGQSLYFAPAWINNTQGITTTVVSSITDTTAISGGNILSSGGAAITDRGVCWSTAHNPTIFDRHTTDSVGIGSFTSKITYLNPANTYYVRTYAINIMGTVYGNEVSFTTTGTTPNLTVTDIDSNVYNTVTIGTQTWMKQNLNVTHYNNGDAIPYVSNEYTWGSYSTGAYCDYSIIDYKPETFGKLYNFYTVVDSRNLCPIGWHVPSNLSSI